MSCTKNTLFLGPVDLDPKCSKGFHDIGIQDLKSSALLEAAKWDTVVYADSRGARILVNRSGGLPVHPGKMDELNAIIRQGLGLQPPSKTETAEAEKLPEPGLPNIMWYRTPPDGVSWKEHRLTLTDAFVQAAHKLWESHGPDYSRDPRIIMPSGNFGGFADLIRCLPGFERNTPGKPGFGTLQVSWKIQEASVEEGVPYNGFLVVRGDKSIRVLVNPGPDPSKTTPPQALLRTFIPSDSWWSGETKAPQQDIGRVEGFQITSGVKCDCGAAKTRETHADWCSTRK